MNRKFEKEGKVGRLGNCQDLCVYNPVPPTTEVAGFGYSIGRLRSHSATTRGESIFVSASEDEFQKAEGVEIPAVYRSSNCPRVNIGGNASKPKASTGIPTSSWFSTLSICSETFASGATSPNISVADLSRNLVVSANRRMSPISMRPK